MEKRQPGNYDQLIESQVSIRVMVVDGQLIAREGLRTILEKIDGIKICGEAADIAGAVRMADEIVPDVVLVEYRLPDGYGAYAIEQIKARRPEVRVIVCTAFSDEEAVIRSIAAGASGYVVKGMGSGELVRAIREVAS